MAMSALQRPDDCYSEIYRARSNLGIVNEDSYCGYFLILATLPAFFLSSECTMVSVCPFSNHEYYFGACRTPKRCSFPSPVCWE